MCKCKGKGNQLYGTLIVTDPPHYPLLFSVVTISSSFSLRTKCCDTALRTNSLDACLCEYHFSEYMSRYFCTLGRTNLTQLELTQSILSPATIFKPVTSEELLLAIVNYIDQTLR